MRVNRTRLRKLEKQAPRPFEPTTIEYVIVTPNPNPGGPPLDLGVAQRTHVLRNESVTLDFAEGADGRWTDLVVRRRRKPTWPDPRRFPLDLIEEFDPPRRQADLPVEPVPDAVAKACETAPAEMSKRRDVALHYGIDLVQFLTTS